MGLLERVSTLIRANINDMVDRAEDPEKMIKQVILDMENQYLQVKTQVAVSIADQHMLEKKWKENEDTGNDWMRKAERAVDKSEDDLARGALDRYQTALRLARQRRSVALGKAARAQAAIGDHSKGATFDRLKDRVHHGEAVATAEVELVTDDVGERLHRMERDMEIERLLADLKGRRRLPG